jgi:hypothetical protein
MGGRVHYKPGEKREKQKAKVKQEDFSKVNNQDQFPQLGASPTKTTKVTKQQPQQPVRTLPEQASSHKPVAPQPSK